MSITPQNGMVAITQSTELFAQVPVHNEQSVGNPAPRTPLSCKPTPKKRREHHLSSSSDSSSSSSETDEEPPPRRKRMARKNGPREPKNWHDHQLTSGTTTWFRLISWPACPHRTQAKKTRSTIKSVTLRRRLMTSTFPFKLKVQPEKCLQEPNLVIGSFHEREA